jgi:hypothetical protein
MPDPRSGGWLPAIRVPIFSGAAVAAWWAMTIPLLLIVILVACGICIWFYERTTGRKIEL